MRSLGSTASEPRFSAVAPMQPSSSATTYVQPETGKGKASKPPAYRSEVHRYIVWLTEQPAFSRCVLVVIAFNLVLIALGTDNELSAQNRVLFDCCNLAFVIVFFAEFVLKLYASPRGYWANGYNRFDFIVLLLSLFDVLQLALASLAGFSNLTFVRVFRVSLLRSLQVIVTALLRTLAEVVNLLLLLVLLMYVFAIVGFNFFGSEPSSQAQWGDLLNGMFALFQLVTVDNWGDQQDLLDPISPLTRLYTVAFVLIGNFVFTNLFIGVVIQNLDEATEEDKRLTRELQRQVVEQRKAAMMARQQEELRRLLTSQKEMQDVDLAELLARKVGKLSHKDRAPTSDLACNLTWLETYMATVNHQEHVMYRLQQLHFELANVLTEMLRRRMSSRQAAGVD